MGQCHSERADELSRFRRPCKGRAFRLAGHAACSDEIEYPSILWEVFRLRTLHHVVLWQVVDVVLDVRDAVIERWYLWMGFGSPNFPLLMKELAFGLQIGLVQVDLHMFLGFTSCEVSLSARDQRGGFLEA